MFPSRVNRISRFYFISSHSLRSRMIDPDDGRNINQNTSWLFARRSCANIFIANCDRDTLELLSRKNREKKIFRTSRGTVKERSAFICARLKIAQNDILACKQHRKLRGPRFNRRSLSSTTTLCWGTGRRRPDPRRSESLLYLLRFRG